MHKLSLYLQSYNCIDQNISKEQFQNIVVITISLCTSIYSFLVTQSELIIYNYDISNNERNIDSTNDDIQKFMTIFISGQLLGCILSFIVNDSFGRQNTLIYSSIFCICSMIWSILTTSYANLLTARFLIGIGIGFMLTSAPTYISEVMNIIII